jgi:hypothetical protein
MAGIMTWVIGLSHHIGQPAQDLLIRIAGEIRQGQSVPRFSFIERPLRHCGIRPHEFLLHCRKTPQLYTFSRYTWLEAVTREARK